MASIPKSKTTNKVLFDTVNDLRKLSNKTKVGTWKAVAQKLSTTASQRAQVNVSKLDKVCKDGELVIVPGKVLGDGIISKKVNVIAFNASDSAISKIEKAGGKFTEIREFIKKEPKDKPRIIG